MFRDIITVIILVFVLLLFIKVMDLVPEKQQIEMDKKLPILASIPSWDQERAMDSFTQHVDQVDYVSFFWYYLDSMGNVRTYRNANVDRSAIEYAHRHDVKVFPIITNLDDDNSDEENWDTSRVNTVIKTEEDRQQHINDLLELTERMDFDGISIDYELLEASQREDFTIFIRELADALHARNKLLGVAIHGRTSDAQRDNGAVAQDLEAIAKSADHLYFMTYLEHTTSSQPGPAGSMDWIENVMKYAIEEQGVPREKIFLGIGLVGLIWQRNEDGRYSGIENDVTYDEVQAIMRQYGAQAEWDERAESPYFQFQAEDGEHVVWFENAESVKERIELAERLGLGGAFLWRLGGEDPAIWDGIEN